MIKGKKIIDSKEYTIEVTGGFVLEKYNFEIRIYSEKDKVISYSDSVPEVFIEDKIDNSRNIRYLEEATLTLAMEHLADFLSPRYRRILKGFRRNRIKYWFREAKRKLEQENENA